MPVRIVTSGEVAYACTWIPLVPLTSAMTLFSTARSNPKLSSPARNASSACVVDQPVPRDPLAQVRDHLQRVRDLGDRVDTRWP